jgi:hypothetical protein
MAIVKYNNQAINPPPFVSRQFEPVNYGNRWGFTQSVDLNGWITGDITGTGVLYSILDIFKQNFKELLVSGENHEYLSIPCCHVEEVSLQSNAYNLIGFGGIPYSVKIKAFDIPSGVLDVSNEYSFLENTDNTITVSHKIAAKGVRNNSLAIENAIEFVKMFTGKNPYSSCLPVFVGVGSGIMLSITENIDRLAGSVSINETYRYNPVTGSNSPNTYVETATLSVTEGRTQDFDSYDLNVEFLGSPIDSNLQKLRTSLSSYNPYEKLAEYGISSGNCYLNTMSINEDSGKNSASLKASFLSGNSGDFAGYFDAQISVNWDEINDLKTYNLNGQFIVRGPVKYRRERITAFKNQVLSSGQFHSYLYSFIIGSQVANVLNTGARVINPLPISFSISENTGQATFSMSASFSDRDFADYAHSVDYSVSVTPERWLFNLYPAANIEGHFVVQDLQCKTREKIKIQTNAQNTGNFVVCYTGLNGLINNLLTNTLSNASPYYFTASGINSGNFSLEVSREVMSENCLSSSLLEGANNKFASSIVSVPTFTRAPGHQFGY